MNGSSPLLARVRTDEGYTDRQYNQECTCYATGVVSDLNLLQAALPIALFLPEYFNLNSKTFIASLD